MKLEKITLANALALATIIIWIPCTLGIVLFPEASKTLMGWWTHGRIVTDYQITFQSALYGGITLVIAFWLMGYVLGWSLELVSKKK